VSITWTGGELRALPPLGVREVGRLAVRSVALAGVTATSLALHLLLRGLDLLRVGRPGLAPIASALWARVALRLAGLRLEHVGRPMERPGAVVANHASWLDIVALMRAAQVFFVAKAEVRGWPLAGAIGRAIGTIFVERRPVEAKRQGMVLEARLARGDRLAFFPEGTSTDGLRVLRFKSALFEAFFRPGLREASWVQPVTIVYRAPSGLPPTFYAWWGEAEFAPSLRDVLARSRGGCVQVIFHEPLRVADHACRKSLARAAEEAVRAGLEKRIGKEDGRGCAGAT
jgi:lyso-ornithine lipid O-acyltransferase